MSVPATSSKDLAQSLYRVLAHVTEGMKPDEVVGDEGDKHACSEWIATARAALKVAQKRTPELVQIEQLEMALALRCRVQPIAEETKAPEIEPLLELLRTQHKALFPNGIPEEFVRTQLHYLCDKYPRFANRLENNQDSWTEAFFKFAIAAPAQSFYCGKRATHWIDIFIKYPEIAERLMKSHLYVKLGLYPENIALIEKVPYGETKGVWHVCLKMDLADKKNNKWVPINFLLSFSLRSIAQPTQGFSLTMEQVFKEFEKPCPDFDVSKDGIINLNPLLLGSKKDDVGTLELIDVSRWRSFKPSIKLEEPELQKKYGALPENFEYGFVLRADRLFSNAASIKSQVSFDFIVRDGSIYRVFSMNPQGHDMHLREQKIVFYSLSPDQAEAVTQRVAEDIKNYRTSHTEGKPTPFINIEPYMDEIFGKAFYVFLTDMASKLENSEQLKKQLAHAKQTFDPEDFENFVSPILQELVKKRNVSEMQNLIKTSLNTLKFLLQIKKVTSIADPDVDAVRIAVTALYNNSRDEEIYKSLLALTRLCFVLLHPYSVKVTDVEKNTPVIGKIVQIVEAIPLRFLRDLLLQLLLLALSHFRNYRYKKPEEDRPQNTFGILARKITDLKPLPYLNQAGQIFETYSEASVDRTFLDITNHLRILAKAAAG